MKALFRTLHCMNLQQQNEAFVDCHRFYRGKEATKISFYSCLLFNADINNHCENSLNETRTNSKIMEAIMKKVGFLLIKMVGLVTFFTAFIFSLEDVLEHQTTIYVGIVVWVCCDMLANFIIENKSIKNKLVELSTILTLFVIGLLVPNYYFKLSILLAMAIITFMFNRKSQSSIA